MLRRSIIFLVQLGLILLPPSLFFPRDTPSGFSSISLADPISINSSYFSDPFASAPPETHTFPYVLTLASTEWIQYSQWVRFIFMLDMPTFLLRTEEEWRGSDMWDAIGMLNLD